VFLAEPLPTSACPAVPNPSGRGCGTSPRSPRQPGSHPERAGFLVQRSSGLLDAPCSFLRREFPAPRLRTPCLPTPSQCPPNGSAWVHEIKHDGYRLIARRDGNRVRLLHAPGLRLERQVSLDCRIAPVSPGPVHHRGRGSGLGGEPVGAQTSLSSDKTSMYVANRWQ
jgi:hypothetical protein